MGSWGIVRHRGVCEWELHRSWVELGSEVVMEEQTLAAWPCSLPRKTCARRTGWNTHSACGNSVFTFNKKWIKRNSKFQIPSQFPYQYSENWYSEIICFLLMLSYSASSTAFSSYLKHTWEITNIVLNPCSGSELCFRWIWMSISHFLGDYSNHWALWYRTTSSFVNLIPSFSS